MTLPRFYVWLPQTSHDENHAAIEIVRNPQVPLLGSLVCPTCFDPVGPLRLQPHGVLDVRRETSGKWPDVNLLPPCIVSKSFATWWQSSGYVAHLELQEITSLSGHGDRPPYYLATIPYGGPEVDSDSSVIRWSRKPSCKTCQRGILVSWSSVNIRPHSWQGEDLFVPVGFTRPLVSERFVRHFEQCGFSGCVFRPAIDTACE